MQILRNDKWINYSNYIKLLKQKFFKVNTKESIFGLKHANIKLSLAGINTLNEYLRIKCNCNNLLHSIKLHEQVLVSLFIYSFTRSLIWYDDNDTLCPIDGIQHSSLSASVSLMNNKMTNRQTDNCQLMPTIKRVAFVLIFILIL